MVGGPYRVSEIFSSVQGEGLEVGRSMTFVRFSGCNRRCWWCDTDHLAYRLMSSQEIVEEVKRYGDRVVCLTGGEPAIQADDPLLIGLLSCGVEVHLETNGTVPLAGKNWYGYGLITVSPKEPLQEHRCHWLNVCCTVKQTVLKVLFVGEHEGGGVGYPFDEIVQSWSKLPWTRCYVQPIFTLDDVGKPVLKAERLGAAKAWLRQHSNWYLSVQVQKFLGWH